MVKHETSLVLLTPGLYLGVGADGAVRAVEQRCTTFVFDVLRAGATLCQLLASPIRPPIWVVRDVDECWAWKDRLGENVVLVGERHAEPIPGFDYGNSPVAVERARERLRGRRVIFTSTAGARALTAGRPGRTYLGSLTNALAVRDRCLQLQRQGRPIALIAASGNFTEDPLQYEDWLVILYILAWFPLPEAAWPWPDFQDRSQDLLADLRATWDWQRRLARTRHGRNLFTRGYGRDVAWIANHFGHHRWVPSLVDHPDNRPGVRMALDRDTP